MEDKEILQGLRNVVNDGARGLTAERIKFVVDVCQDKGIEFIPNKRCKNCYIDKAAELYRMLLPEQATEGRKYVLKAGTDLLFNGKPVNESTADTDEKCEKLITAGLDKKYFIINED